MKPFFYGMKIIAAYDTGAVLDAETVAISPEFILGKFSEGVKNITALSLQTGIPTEVAVPHLVIDGFKNLAAIGFNINYLFK